MMRYADIPDLFGGKESSTLKRLLRQSFFLLELFLGCGSKTKGRYLMLRDFEDFIDMKDFFEGIQYLFMDVLFVPFTYLRLDVQPESWLMANALNFFFILIGFVLFFYWMKQLKIFSKTEVTKDDDEVFLI